MSCGCCMPKDDHNDYNNITYATLLKAMVSGNVDTVDELIENIEDCYAKMQTGSVDDSESGMSNDIGPVAQPAY